MITRAVCRVLVGREEELSTLEDALLAACRGEGSVVVISGDAGIGKSRLCTELKARAETIGATVLDGSCSEADLALPYLPFLEAVGNYLSSVPAKNLRERLGVHARELGRLFPQLAEDGPASSEPETPDRRLRLFEAFLALLGLASEERGLLLVVEDIHWADASTRELLDYLTRRLRSQRVLLVGTYRRDEMHRKHPLLPTIQGWQRSRLAQLIELEPLQPQDVARMVSSIFDNTDVGEEFRDFIHARSEGNPFVLEEMLKSAMDRGDIYHDEADWQRKPIAQLRIPETVRDTILLRVERLEAGQAEVLQCAAVVGRTFDYQTLIRLSEQDRRAVEKALQTAVQQQLLEEEPGSSRYRFRHALTQEAIYEDLSAPMRERLHSAAADVLGTVPDTPKAEIALHLRNAHRWDEAIKMTMEAAAADEARLGYGEAAALYSVLLPVVTTGIERARLLCKLGEAYWLTGNPGRAWAPLKEGVGLLENLGEPLEAARHRLTLGRCYWERSESNRGRAEYEHALQVLEPAGASRDLALAYIRLAGLHGFSNEAAEEQEMAEKAIRTADEVDAPDLRIWASIYLGMAIAWQGDYPKGIRCLEQCAQEALERGLHHIAGNALHNVISYYVFNFDLDKLVALPIRLEGLRIERWANLSSVFAREVWEIGTGHMEDALVTARELAARARFVGDRNSLLLAQDGICISCIELDRFEEARTSIRELDPNGDAQDVLDYAFVWISFNLAIGDLAEAVKGAEVLGGVARPEADPEAALGAIEAFARVGRFDDALRVLAALERGPAPLHRVLAGVGRARIQLATGEAADSISELGHAIQALQAAGLARVELRARLLLAEVTLREGRRAEAEAEYRTVLETSRGRGLRLLERRAIEGLAAMGIVVEAPMSPAQPRTEGLHEIGERLVTVMFADVRGYTAMTGERAPVEMVDRIATYQRWAAQEVERHLGTVDKFAGDAVMATFNISGTQIDHAAHALQAALALRDKAGMLGLPVGIGIATGPAVVGALKSGANISVVGETTNLASRLQSQAAAGEVVLSDETYRRLVDSVDAAPEHLQLKGFAQPVIAYRVAAHATTSRP